MSVPKIANAISFIDDELISEAESFAPKKSYKATAVKIAATSLAACLIIAVSVPLLRKDDYNVTTTICTDDKAKSFSFVEIQTHHIFAKHFPDTLPKGYHPDGEIYVYDDTTLEAVFCNHYTGDAIYLIISPKKYFADIKITDKVLYPESEDSGNTSYIYVETGDYIAYYFSEKCDLATLEGFDKMIESTN